MDEKVDYRLANLGRYVRGTPRERFNLWFAHPGLRACFDALDKNRPEAGPAAVLAGPNGGRRTGSKGRGAAVPLTAVGTGRGG